MTAEPALLWSIGLWLLVIAVVDIWCQKAPNLLLVLALVPAVLALVVNGNGVLDAGAGSSVAGFALGGLVTLPGYLLHKMGAGDVKLAMVLGLLSGITGAVTWLLYGFIVLGAVSLVVWFLRNYYGIGGEKIPAAAAFVAGFMGWMLWGDLPALASL